jgi:chemotaxis protein histidine kinase CheA
MQRLAKLTAQHPFTVFLLVSLQAVQSSSDASSTYVYMLHADQVLQAADARFERLIAEQRVFQNATLQVVREGQAEHQRAMNASLANQHATNTAVVDALKEELSAARQERAAAAKAQDTIVGESKDTTAAAQVAAAAANKAAAAAESSAAAAKSSAADAHDSAAEARESEASARAARDIVYDMANDLTTAILDLPGRSCFWAVVSSLCIAIWLHRRGPAVLYVVFAPLGLAAPMPAAPAADPPAANAAHAAPAAPAAPPAPAAPAAGAQQLVPVVGQQQQQQQQNVVVASVGDRL